MNRVKVSLLLSTALFGLMVATGGCFFAGIPTITTEIPAALQIILDNPEQYASDAPFEPAGVAVGTTVDDLAGLTGCWATYNSGRLADSGVVYDVFYEAYQFDAQTGNAVRWVHTPSWFFIPPVLVIDEGTYELVSEGRIRITLTSYSFSNLRTRIGMRYTNVPPTVETIEKLVTLSGDLLLLASPEYVDEDTGEPLARVYHKFECPE